jgi:hypothetical protein
MALDGVQLCVGRFQSHARPQPAHHFADNRPGRMIEFGGLVFGERGDRVYRIGAREDEIGRQNAYDCKLASIENNRPPQDFRIAGKLPAPQAIAHQGYRVPAFIIFIFKEVAAQGGRYAENRQKGSGYPYRLQLQRLCSARQITGDVPVSRQIGKRLILPPPFQKIGCKGDVVGGVRLDELGHPHQPFALNVR